jgi:hypothetical protein
VFTGPQFSSVREATHAVVYTSGLSRLAGHVQVGNSASCGWDAPGAV